MSFDFSILDTRKKSNEGAFLHLRHPGTGAKLYDKENNPVGLYILGRDSDAFIASNHAKNNARLNDVEAPKPTSESIENDNIDLLAGLTVGWAHVKHKDEETFTRELVSDFYRTYRWAYEQANSFAGERGNFI